MNAAGDHLLIRVLRGQTVDRVPVWAMRQAGRWDPEYVNLRKFGNSLEGIEWATRASLLPQRFGVDAILPVYDFTVLTSKLGLTFVQNRDLGLMPERPLRTRQDVDNLGGKQDFEHFEHTTFLIQNIRRELRNELPIVTTADAPFSLAVYCLGLSTNFELLRIFVREHADVWAMLLDRLTNAVGMFVKSLIASGTDVLLLSDSLAAKLTEDEYDRWALRAHKAVLQCTAGTPSIIHVKQAKSIEAMSASGADAVSIGSSVNLAEVRRRYPQLIIHGNLSTECMRTGAPLDVIQAAQSCITQSGGQRHILGFDRRLPNDTKPEHFAALIATARSFHA